MTMHDPTLKRRVGRPGWSPGPDDYEIDAVKVSVTVEVSYKQRMRLAEIMGLEEVEKTERPQPGESEEGQSRRPEIRITSLAETREALREIVCQILDTIAESSDTSDPEEYAEQGVHSWIRRIWEEM